MQDKIKDKIVEINTSSQHLKGLLEVISEMYLVEPSHIDYVKVGDIEQAKITFIPVKPEIRIECDTNRTLDIPGIQTGRFNSDKPNESNGPSPINCTSYYFCHNPKCDNHRDTSKPFLYCCWECDDSGNDESNILCNTKACNRPRQHDNYYCETCKIEAIEKLNYKPKPCTNNECVIKHNDDTDCKH